VANHTIIHVIMLVIASHHRQKYTIVHTRTHTQGTLTDDSLQTLFSRYQTLCGNRKGVDITVFDQFVDELARMYAASRAAQEGLAHGEGTRF